MSTSAVAVRRLALAALAIGAAPAFAQGSSEPGTITVHPAKVPVAGSPPAYERGANLPSPPPGPIESRLVPIPEGGNLRLRGDLRYGQPAPASAPASAVPTAPAFTPPPSSSPAPAAVRSAAAEPSGSALAARKPAGEPAALSDDTPIAAISFASQSANLTDVTRSELDQIAKRITDKRFRRIELHAFATGEPDSRKIALARALVVRSYLIDRGVKSRIEVGGFSGDGERVDILVPNT
jgi:outer membrane protein OmpA-like peptidoglycan-associated protein